MPARAGNLDHAQRQAIADPAEIHAKREDGDKNQARRDRRSLEIFYLAGVVGELASGDVVAR